MQSGFLLVTAIFLLVILAALGAFILTISGTQQTSSALDVQGARAYQAARAGIEWASDQVLTNGCTAGYLYGRTVTIDHTKVPNTDRSNFPVLFSGTYSYLATVANGGKVTNASGFDIIFIAGATKLDHEIESYNAATGAVNFWVRVPTVSSTTDTVISLCYGNAAITTSQENKTGVWDTNFKGVWHLNEATAANRLDSTANANTLTPSASQPTLVAGQIANAANFAMASSQKLSRTDALQTGLDIIGPITVEAWVNLASVNLTMGIVDKWRGSGTVDPPYMLRANNGDATHDGPLFQESPNSTTANTNVQGPPTSMAASTWYHIVGVYDGTNLLIYKNGAQDATPVAYTLGSWNSDGDFEVGTRSAQYFNGIIDEVRISSSARSADWVTTEYNNQSSPSTFYTLGAESNAGVLASACTPGPTTQNVTGMGGTLSGFTATVTCSSTTTTEGGAPVTVYQITSRGYQGTVGTLDRVERELQVTLTK